MEAGGHEEITPEKIQVRQVTHYQPGWTETAPGQAGTFTIQLILDEGADEYVIRPTADDADVLFEMLDREDNAYFDLGRKVLVFGNREIG